MTNKDVGDAIRLLRTRNGLSQERLGKLAGMDARRISKYETGYSDLKVSALIRIADALGVRPSVILAPELVQGTGTKQKRHAEIRVYQVEDRMAVASILVKNGYTVSQVKRAKEGQKTVEYRLRLEESEDNVRIVR